MSPLLPVERREWPTLSKLLGGRCHQFGLVTHSTETPYTCPFVLDAYPTQHLIYEWKSDPGVVVLDKEMAQFYMKKMTTAIKRVDYVAGTRHVFIDKVTATFI